VQLYCLGSCDWSRPCPNHRDRSKYRLHKARGVAVVTLNGATTTSAPTEPGEQVRVQPSDRRVADRGPTATRVRRERTDDRRTRSCLPPLRGGVLRQERQPRRRCITSAMPSSRCTLSTGTRPQSASDRSPSKAVRERMIERNAGAGAWSTSRSASSAAYSNGRRERAGSGKRCSMRSKPWQGFARGRSKARETAPISAPSPVRT